MLIKSQTSRDTFNRQTFDVIRKETRQVNKQKSWENETHSLIFWSKNEKSGN